MQPAGSADVLSGWENVIAPKQQAQPVQAVKKKDGGLKGLLESFLPTIGGTLGAIGGSLIAPGAGTAGGGAVGSGIGEWLKEHLSGEKTSFGNIARESALGAIPGGLEAIGGGIKAARAGEGFLSGMVGRTAATGAEQAATEGATNAVEEAASKSGRIKTLGDNLQQDVINPKVPASVGGAQKEAQMANEVASNVKGLSAKAKYANLQPAMDEVTQQITPILEKSTGTVGKDSLVATIKDNAEASGHFLAGDPTYERQLDSVLNDITAKTGGSSDLSAKQLFDYKKGMDMDSVFTKLAKGADLNPKEAARLAVWSSMDDAITTAEPTAKALTQRQSFLMQSAKGLKQNANKAAGIPLLGIKSKTAEQAIQASKTLAGKTLSGAGGSGFLGALTKQGITRAIGEPILNPTAPVDPTATGDLSSLDANGTDPTSLGASDTTTASDSPFAPENVQTNIQKIMSQGGTMKDVSDYLSNVKAVQDLTSSTELPKAQQTLLSNAQRASGLLDTVYSQFEQLGGAQGRVGGFISGLSGKAGLNDNVNAYNTARTDAAIPLAQALSGSTRLPPPETLKLIEDMLPNFGDNEQEVTIKKQLLQQRLNSAIQAIQSGTLTPSTSS